MQTQTSDFTDLSKLSAELNKLSNDELLAQTEALTEAERQTTLAILHALAEIDRRRAYAKRAYPNLWEYAIGELK